AFAGGILGGREQRLADASAARFRVDGDGVQPGEVRALVIEHQRVAADGAVVGMHQQVGMAVLDDVPEAAAGHAIGFEATRLEPLQGGKVVERRDADHVSPLGVRGVGARIIAACRTVARGREDYFYVEEDWVKALSRAGAAAVPAWRRVARAARPAALPSSAAC